MGLNPRELSFDFKPTYIPKTISQFLGEVSRIDDVSERLFKLYDFVDRLEAEMRKIDAFKRELPLCMLLINDAIFALKEEGMQFRKQNAEPVLEEFIPLKKSCDEVGKDEIQNKEKDSGDKKNWLSSTQLWNTDDDHPSTKPNQIRNKNSVLEIKKRVDEGKAPVIDNSYQLSRASGGRAFMPFKGYCSFPAMGTRKEDKEELPVSSGLSLITPGIKNQREELRPSGVLSSKISSSRPVSCSSPNVESSLRTAPQPPQQQNSRKQRRCWSPELHRRFVNALQQLGGSQAATPKQIRELMQVDGLTNDEVKSHLQKYRLHTRRLPSSTTTSPANQSPVVLGGSLWMAQDQSSESSKQSTSQNGSPQGPLQLNGANGGTSTSGGDSMEDDDEDEKSESYSWKSHTHTSGKDDV